MWEEMGWDEKSWDEVRWGEKSSHDLRWDEVWSVKIAVWSVRKVFAWRCIAPGSRAGHVLGQQHCNSFAQSTHARAWLAHGACKFYRWERSYSILLRQLLPHLVRVLLVHIYICVYIYMCVLYIYHTYIHMYICVRWYHPPIYLSITAVLITLLGSGCHTVLILHVWASQRWSCRETGDYHMVTVYIIFRHDHM